LSKKNETDSAGGPDDGCKRDNARMSVKLMQDSYRTGNRRNFIDDLDWAEMKF